MASTATVSTVSPQTKPSASGMPPMAACTVALGGAGHHGEKPFLFAQARAQKAHKNAQHPKCQRTHDQKQCLCAHLAQIADVHRCTHQHKQEHLGCYPEFPVFYREPFCHYRSLFLLTDADKHNCDQRRESDGGGQSVLRCHQQEGDAQNDQHLCGIPDMYLCKEVCQQGPDRQPHRHAHIVGRIKPYIKNRSPRNITAPITLAFAGSLVGRVTTANGIRLNMAAHLGRSVCPVTTTIRNETANTIMAR